MKKVLVTLAAAVVMSAAVALAATPTPPTFNMTVKATKVADGYVEAFDSRQVVVDGNNVYVGFNGSSYDGEPRVARSTDGGLTWAASALLSPTGGTVRIAKAKDPLQTGKNVIVATWPDVDGLKYSYFYDRPTGAGWSAPIVITTAPVDVWTLKIASSPNGNVHVFFNDGANINQLTASSADSGFATSPVIFPWGADSANYSIAFDSNNNMYASETNFNGTVQVITFHKKLASSSTWTNVAVASDTWDNTSIAVYDANNIYIAYKQYTPALNTGVMTVAVSTNGGTSWTKRTITPNATVYGTYPSITVNSSKVITVVGHYVEWGPTGRITINKSSDNGATWSANVTVPGNANPSSTLDANGKVVVLSSQYGPTELDPKFYAGTATDWGVKPPVYFTREK